MSGKNIILSYVNPDTDGVACAIGMATLLSSTDEKWEPVLMGSVGMETCYVLGKAGIPKPQIITHFQDVDKIILVDTHHVAQLPMQFPYDKVIMIIDHHSNGDDNIFTNATIRNEKIGAAASIVAEELILKEKMSSNLAFMLGCAIVSNTLNFTAPSTTEYDRNIYDIIKGIVDISDQDIEEMFNYRSSILTQNIYDALKADFKVFNTKVGSVGIAQIEAYNLDNVINLHQTVEALDRIAHEKELDYCLFNGVDIKKQTSIVLAANRISENLICKIFEINQYTEPVRIDRILLRKTDFVPKLNE